MRLICLEVAKLLLHLMLELTFRGLFRRFSMSATLTETLRGFAGSPLLAIIQRTRSAAVSLPSKGETHR
jgi:hypothetical protein